MQWLSCRVLHLRQRGHGFQPHWRHCVVSLSKNINSSLVLVQPRKTHPFITERLLMGRKELNQTKQTNKLLGSPGLKVVVSCSTELSMFILLINIEMLTIVCGINTTSESTMFVEEAS